jgi:signal transduction histidine kinase
MDYDAHREGYRAFLQGRWAPRRRLLGVHAVLGSLVIYAFDLALARSLPPYPTILEIAALRLTWAVFPVVGGLVASGQRPGLRLRRELERTVSALEVSSRRAAEATAALQRLASRVSPEVNNPLAAVKVNVGSLRDAGNPAERREVVEETLTAVDRIARILAELRQKTAPEDEALTGGQIVAPESPTTTD